MGFQNHVSLRGRRAARRYETSLHAGRILNHDRGHLCDCILHDVSTDGARIVLAKNLTLPNALFLYDGLSEKYLAATLVWRQGPVVGLQFVGSGN